LREAGKRARHVAETQFSRDQLAARLEAVLLASAEPTQSTAQRATSSST
jgi:hypothetical protein